MMFRFCNQARLVSESSTVSRPAPADAESGSGCIADQFWRSRVASLSRWTSAIWWGRWAVDYTVGVSTALASNSVPGTND